MINVRLVGDERSPEYKFAVQLKLLFESDIEKGINGNILIVQGWKCFGEKRSDIDIVVLGELGKGFYIEINSKAQYRKDEAYSELDFLRRKVYINNFCFCIEIKSHSQENVRFQATQVCVRYDGRWHDASSQSFEQMQSLRNFLKNILGWSPYICHFIWTTNLESKYLKEQLAGPQNGNFEYFNLLPNKFNLRWLFQLACLQNIPFTFPDANYCTFRSSFPQNHSNESIDLFYDKFSKAINFFSMTKENVGLLTRQRLERITKSAILKDQLYAKSIGEKLVVIRGRAGTGKTIKLLHIAYDLCSKRERRCLILTYNKALVSDIKRLIALAGLDDGTISAPTISVKTVHSFIRLLLMSFGILKGEKDDDDQSIFLKEYDNLKKDLVECIRSGLIEEKDIQDLMMNHHEEVAWDHVLIDESQDWPDDEREILFKIFNFKKFIIADGMDQLVRKGRPTNWLKDIEYHKPIIHEKRSLRQKKNLCNFTSSYISIINTLVPASSIRWDLLPNDELPGGRVTIVEGGYSRELHEKFYEDCKKSGNKAYEMLFLVPPSLTEKYERITKYGTKKDTRFKLADTWSNWGIKIWDGTSSINRNQYPTDVDAHRVVQYDSCRGLEGWNVICLGFDDFFKYKMETIDANNDRSNIQLEVSLKSKEEIMIEQACLWSLIPLTRAIDHIIITLDHKDSIMGHALQLVHDQNRDLVEWIHTNK